MPGYFLNISNGEGFTRDAEGSELPALDAARQRAIDGVRSILSDEIKSGVVDLGGRVEIADDTGGVLSEVPFSSAVRILMPSDPAAAQGLPS